LLEWFAFLFPPTIAERRSRRAVVVGRGGGEESIDDHVVGLYR
jgi:hypothetical protein